ncbi:hypothetical protein KEM52_004665 [Ascosphaera acerosa]|nr:hypothetical protein KEM52_004665 [Ascosphaera acerosa]
MAIETFAMVCKHVELSLKVVLSNFLDREYRESNPCPGEVQVLLDGFQPQLVELSRDLECGLTELEDTGKIPPLVRALAWSIFAQTVIAKLPLDQLVSRKQMVTWVPGLPDAVWTPAFRYAADKLLLVSHDHAPRA